MGISQQAAMIYMCCPPLPAAPRPSRVFYPVARPLLPSLRRPHPPRHQCRPAHCVGWSSTTPARHGRQCRAGAAAEAAAGRGLRAPAAPPPGAGNRRRRLRLRRETLLLAAICRTWDAWWCCCCCSPWLPRRRVLRRRGTWLMHVVQPGSR
jgi:hypothetical protein